MEVMSKLKNDYKDRALIGYSDHTEGNEVSIMAVSFGAKIIEKHFTLDKNMEGPDHFASAEPEEMKALVYAIRNIEKAFGSDKKDLTDVEKVNIKYMRRSIHASKNIEKGQIIKASDITITRPYDGLSAWDYEEVIGKETLKDIDKGNPIKRSDLNWK